MRKEILVAIILITMLGCKKSKSPAPGVDPPVVDVPAPAKPSLTAPTQNETCFTGQSISNTQSTVAFSWNAAANAESYDVVIKNLLTNTSTTHAATQASLQVTLLKNTPYSWYVRAKTSKTAATTQSDSWKFHNAGDAVVSYAPFPAEAVSPVYAENITATNNSVTLKWTSSDVDNDIVSHTVHFGTSATPAVLNANVVLKELNVTVTPNTIYYWKVVTKDGVGNTSDSGVFQFKVN